MELGSRVTFGLVLIVGVAGTGLLVRLLNVAGYPVVGSATWAVGYAVTIGLLWYGWFREMDISGQSGTGAGAPTDAGGEREEE